MNAVTLIAIEENIIKRQMFKSQEMIFYSSIKLGAFHINGNGPIILLQK